MPLSRLRRPLFLALAGYALALCALRSLGALAPPRGAGWETARGAEVEVEGALAGPPRLGTRGSRAVVSAALVAGRPCRLALLVLFRAGARPLPDPGSRLRLLGRLRRPRPPRGPGEFDERAYLEDRGLSLILHARSWEAAGRDGSWRGLLLARAEGARRSVQSQLGRAYAPGDRALLGGILLGDKGGLDPGLSRAMKDIGAFHLIVPSGTNVAFVLAFFLWVGGALRLSGLARLALPLAMAGFYGLMVGGDPPYLRAFLCAALAALGRWLDRESDLFQALTLSALMLLVWDPRLLFHRGFQMSYLVVWALAVSEPHQLPPRHWPRPARQALALLAASAVAQLSLVPVLSRIGGVFSPVGILANLALIPLSGLLLGGGYAAWGLSFLPWGGPEAALASLTGLLARAFRGLCLFCAAYPGLRVDLAPMPPLTALGYGAALLGALSWRARRAAAALMLSGAGLMLASALARRALSR